MTELGVLYEKKVNCLVCDKNFKTSKVRVSKLKLHKMDSDFLYHYKEENPVKYEVFVCPYCGYAAMEKQFDHISLADKNVIKENISSKWTQRSFGGKRNLDTSIEAYKLALYNGQLLDYSKLELGNITIRLAWLYRLRNVEDEEHRFLKATKELYKDAYYKESLENHMEVITLSYLIGELSRKLGEKEEAISWFNNTLKNPEIKNNPRLENMVREQWVKVKEG